jgi:hypothetical protein
MVEPPRYARQRGPFPRIVDRLSPISAAAELRRDLMGRMCCFSRPVRFVGKTKIFARGLADGRQLLVYAMDVELAEELAMVLPLPVPPSPGDDAVRFVDLSGYPRFFEDLDRAFPMPVSRSQKAASFGAPTAAAVLPVHDVGDFEASFVPTRADFARLDPRFRLPDALWDRMPRYADFGFAVFRLRPRKALFGAKRQSVHPMAFSFPRRAPTSLFFPTVHVHDGRVPDTAAFDHSLYVQAEGVLDRTLAWDRSTDRMGCFVDGARAAGVVDPDVGAKREVLAWTLPNEDVWLHAPTGVSLSDLEGRGDAWAFRVNGTAAHALAPSDARGRAWKETAASGLGDVARRLREGLPAFVSTLRARARLAELTDALPEHFMNGPQLWSGTSYMNGRRVEPGGPGRLALRPFTERVEPQDVTLAFSALPDEDTLAEIVRALGRLVDPR